MYKEQVIMGIDPGLAYTGWAVILKKDNAFYCLKSGTIKTLAANTIDKRLFKIFSSLDAVIKEFKPSSISIERIFINNNYKSALMLGEARGVAILSASINGISLSEYQNLVVKKSTVGVGHATKQQVANMVKILIKQANPKSEHEADAMAIAFTHANTNYNLKNSYK